MSRIRNEMFLHMESLSGKRLNFFDAIMSYQMFF